VAAPIAHPIAREACTISTRAPSEPPGTRPGELRRRVEPLVGLALVLIAVALAGWSFARPAPPELQLDPPVDEEELPEADPPRRDPVPETEPDPEAEREPEAEVLWSGEFTSGWEEQFGVRVANRTNAEVVDRGPAGRADALRITFGEDDERWGIDYRHDLSDLGLPGLEAARFAYDVYFPEDFEFIGDGKFGGVAGITDGLEPLETSAGGTYDERSFSVRAMWKEDRGVVMYLYARQAAGRDFDDPEHFGYGIPERFVGPDGRTEDILTPGRWHRVEHRVTLNTPGQPDGRYELWIDGHRGVAVDDVEYRTSAHPDLHLNLLMTTWFFGGSQDEYPTRVNEAYTARWELAVPREHLAAAGQRTDPKEGTP
jgi:hypothetical protein